ncbi:MAG: alpha-galactosidase [Deltaproteobacteria bacterium]|nr:alpha-galactosidase [Deltaproteobacteria bacterium]
MKTGRTPLLLLPLLLFVGCEGCGDGPETFPLHLPTDRSFEVRWSDDGRISVLRPGATDASGAILEGAFAEVEVLFEGDPEPAVYRSTEGYTLVVSARRLEGTGPGEDALAVELAYTGHPGAPDLFLTLEGSSQRPYLTAGLRVRNATGEALVVTRAVPLKIDAEAGGALRLGAHPADHRILEAGSYLVSDFFVDLVPGDVASSAEREVLGEIHGWQRGHSISNWHHAIRDQETGLTLVAGALDFERSSPMFNTSFDAALATEAGGRTGFTYWSGEFPLLPQGKRLEPEESLEGGTIYLAPAEVDALAALERYADAVKAWNGITLFTERSPDHRIPTGWNSWTGSGSSGGYGATIDQDLMIANLDAMAEEFGDFGGEWFQIDDGYEHFYGDWDWRTDRFPDGAAWMADQIEARGLIPGVWIAPFQLDQSSQTYLDHVAEGWFAPQHPLFGGGMAILDLSHPAVQDWLEDRFRQIRADGYRWLKTDFVYWALGATDFYEDDLTREEAYRMGLAAIQRGLDAGALEAGGQPGDTFWLSVSMLGPHLGRVDSLRMNLDTMPAWEKDQASQTRAMAQGFKPTVRTIARRYFLHDRVFHFNHDMLFFRSHPDPGVPPITRDEARALLTAMALSGSVTKLGEKIVEMQPEWIADYRTAIPVFGKSARPLDLFEREYPEVWHLPVRPSEGLNTGGGGPAYDVVALFNWGTNDDLTTNPYTPMADAARAVRVDLEALGLLEGPYLARDFFTGEVFPVEGGALERTVQPHSVQLLALRPRRDWPTYLGGNRHLLQGAVEVKDLLWEGPAETLTLRYDAAPGSAAVPFEHALYFHLPPGFDLASVAVVGADSASILPATTTHPGVPGEVLELRFSVDARQEVTILLEF